MKTFVSVTLAAIACFGVMALVATSAEALDMTAKGCTANTGADRHDIDRRHLFKVPVDGSAPPVPLTSGTGLEWSPVVTGDGQTIEVREYVEKPEDIRPALDRAQKKVDEGMVALVNVKTDYRARAQTVRFSNYET